MIVILPKDHFGKAWLNFAEWDYRKRCFVEKKKYKFHRKRRIICFRIVHLVYTV